MRPKRQTAPVLTEPDEPITRVRLACGLCDLPAPSQTPPDYCPGCGAERFWLPIETPMGILATTQHTPTRFYPCPGFEGVFPRGIPLSPQLWSGEPGCGKSRLAARLGSTVGRCGYLSLEMPWELSAEIAQSAGARLERLSFWESATKFLEDDPTGLRVVVVDSAQALGRGAAEIIAKLTAYGRANHAAVVWISQINAKGKRKGGPSLAHAVDIELTLRCSSAPGYCDVTTKKNRLQLPVLGTVILPLGAK